MIHQDTPWIMVEDPPRYQPPQRSTQMPSSHPEDSPDHGQNPHATNAQVPTRERQGIVDNDEVEDLLQETFAKAFVPKARTGYTGLSPYGPYINGIARNLVIDEFRRRRREMSLFFEEGADGYMEDVGDEAPIGDWTRGSKGPEQLNIRREEQEMVQTFVASLDDELRTVVNLRFIENLSQDETAEPSCP